MIEVTRLKNREIRGIPEMDLSASAEIPINNAQNAELSSKIDFTQYKREKVRKKNTQTHTNTHTHTDDMNE